MNGKLLWRTGMSIFGLLVAAILIRNCKEIRQDHEQMIRMEERQRK